MSAPRLLVAVQFCPEDRAHAMKLARCMADLEPRFNESTEILFASRFDCEADPVTVDYVSRKFRTASVRGWQRAVGWPGGCTGVWLAVLQWTYAHIYQVSGLKRRDYAAVFPAEADSIPLVRGWTDRLLEEWERKRVFVLGHLIENPRHINGSAMLSCEEPFLRAVLERLADRSKWQFAGFDVTLAPFFEAWGWANTELIRSYWRHPTFDRDLLVSLVGRGAVWYHGIKSDAGFQTVRAFYGLGAA
jgi:hypothetical protein